MKKLIISAMFFFCLTAFAHAGTGHGLKADGSLATRVTKKADTFKITGGTAMGANLFHSFSDFNVEQGQIADFIGNQSLSNIIGRVTGANDSWINGTIKTTDTAAGIYLLNPHGVMFGPDASLDVQGSFHVSTADWLMKDEVRFDVHGGPPSIINTPSAEAFGFLDSDAGNITFNGTNLLISKDMHIDAKNIEFTDGATIYFRTVRQKQGGAVRLNAKENVTFLNGSHIKMESWLGGDGGGDAGDLEITAGKDIVFRDSGIASQTYSQGNGGNVTLKAGGRFELSAYKDYARILVATGKVGNMPSGGDAGTIMINANDILIKSAGQCGADINSSTGSTGDAGTVILGAKEKIVIDGSGNYPAISSSSGFGGRPSYGGKGGYVGLNAPEIILKNRAKISADTNYTGKLITGMEGQGGSIGIIADSLILRDGSEISASSFGTGAGGNILIGDAALAELYASKRDAAGVSKGPADIFLTTIRKNGVTATRNVLLTNGSAIYSGTKGAGNAGRLTVAVKNDVQLRSKSILGTTTLSTGDAGSIIINAGNNLEMSGGAMIASESKSNASGAGRAGNISINTGDSILMSYDGRITTSSENAGTGVGGGIDIRTTNMLRLLNSWITTDARGGEAAGGNITIDPIFVILQNQHPYTVGINNSRITANAYGGPGGNITIVTDYLIKAPDSVIEASSALSSPGEVSMQAKDFNVAAALSALNTDLLDASKWSKARCGLSTGKRKSRLVVAGKDAAPAAFDDLLSGISSLLKEDDSERGPRVLRDNFHKFHDELPSGDTECEECGE